MENIPPKLVYFGKLLQFWCNFLIILENIKTRSGADGKTETVSYLHLGNDYAHNIWGNDLIGQIRKIGTSIAKYYFLKDHLGSIRMTINSSCAVVGYDDYYPFGVIMPGRSQVSSSDNKYKFTSKERDTETGYDYFGARYYDSELGRWLSVDPLADKYLGLSPYNYTLNNPLRFVDPDGREIKEGPWDWLIRFLAKQIGKKLGKEISNPGEQKKGFGNEGEDIDYDGIPDDQDEKNGWEYKPDETKRREQIYKDGRKRLEKALEDFKKEQEKKDKERQEKEKNDREEKERQEKERKQKEEKEMRFLENE